MDDLDQWLQAVGNDSHFGESAVAEVEHPQSLVRGRAA